MKIAVAHDFICPWCWIGFFQAKRLERDFGVVIDWQGYELWPESLAWPEPSAAIELPENKPLTPSRFALMCFAEGIEQPTVERPHQMRTNNVHQAVEYAKTEGVQDQLIEVYYRAYWERGENINDPVVAVDLARNIVNDVAALEMAILTNAFDDKVVDFDDDAYALGVYNVPTFFIGEKRYAEQPYRVLKQAMEEILTEPEVGIYRDLEFPLGVDGVRPYVFINMVSTIDGKIITGERDEPVGDLGSKTDHLLMYRLEAKADAVLVGANSLRATPKTWNPKTTKRVVVTRSGDVPFDSAFLSNGEPYLAIPEVSNFELPEGVEIIRVGKDSVDWHELLQKLYSLGVKRLNVLGGSDLNATLLEQDLVDELFLTLAPKIKLGKDTPTYAGGHPLPRDKVQDYELAEHHNIDNELFLRYKRKRI